MRFARQPNGQTIIAAAAAAAAATTRTTVLLLGMDEPSDDGIEEMRGSRQCGESVPGTDP